MKMAIHTQKCEQKLLKINKAGGLGIKVSWVVKNRKINNRGGGRLFGAREYMHSCVKLIN